MLFFLKQVYFLLKQVNDDSGILVFARSFCLMYFYCFFFGLAHKTETVLYSLLIVNIVFL